MNRIRITVEIDPALKEGMERKIKAEYPKIKNVSQLVRLALEQFLESGN